ncbi:MAG: branched-chain amino acid ABC transporter permease [Ignavibacteriae bacterium]|nr:branched-chain amino acid ABC transporter permease [Ignavibacteriota bacterium]
MVNQLLLNGIIAGSIYSLVALGFALIYQTTRFFHFAHGAVYTFGAYLAFLFYIQLGLDRWLAFPLACLATMVVGVGLEVVVYKSMRNRKATDLTLLIASLGLYIVLQNIISMIWGDDTKTMRTGEVVEGHEIFGARITDIQIAIIITSIMLITLTALIMTQTKFGKALRALANDSELARLSGINSDRYIMYAFAIGSFLAAVAAIMISFDTDMTPTMGFNALVMGVIAVIVGGIGSLPGAALGGLFIGLAQNLGVWQLPSKWQDTIAFVILILFLLFRPYGILGKKPQKVQI